MIARLTAREKKVCLFLRRAKRANTFPCVHRESFAPSALSLFLFSWSTRMAAIVMQAPGPDIAFAALPSGSTYTSDANALIVISNGSVNDQLALIDAGCVTLGAGGGGAPDLQTATSYTLALSDSGQETVCT